MRRRHKNHAVTAMTRPRPGHDGHGHVQGTTDTAPRPQARRPCTTDADATRPRSCTVTSPAITAYKGTRPRDTTRHATRQPNKHSSEQTFDRTRVPMLRIQQTPGYGSVPPVKKPGRLLSSADAECSLEHFWITCYSRSLHIFSGCNRCCTLHIVYNVPWIDVDGGEASLSHINVWPSTHKGSVKILDAVRSAVRLVYLGRGLYGLVPIILGWSAIMLAQPFGCRVRFPRFALGFMGVAACEIDGIARISPLEHVGDKRLPALIRWLMTEGEARPNGCIYTYTFLAVGGKSQSTIPLSCQLGQ